MEERKLKPTDLRLGNLVYMGETAKYPMQVIGLYQDCVILDFEGNEGDYFEVKAEDVRPIPITAEILEKNGFRHIEIQSSDLDSDGVEDIWINNSYDQEVALQKFYMYDSLVFGYGGCLFNGVDIKYIHELQNAMYLCGIEMEIEL